MGAWGQRVIAGVGTPEADPRKREREGHMGHQGPRRACLPTVSLLKNLKHANIVTLHDLIHTERSLTLVFEYLVSWALLPSPLWWEGRDGSGLVLQSGSQMLAGRSGPRAQAQGQPGIRNLSLAWAWALTKEGLPTRGQDRVGLSHDLCSRTAT